jgi:antitoxin (DNA-binding transcriptional repressor) of toxin-antitoxin stability system
MSSFVDISEVQTRLPELLEKIPAGQELFITQDGHPIAKLVKMLPRDNTPRQPGSAIGKIVILEDDDSHLEDFKEYM